MIDIDVKVTRKVTTNIRASLELEDGTKLTAKSMATGIKLTILKPSGYNASEIMIPEAAFDALGEVFTAVRTKREENAE